MSEIDVISNAIDKYPEVRTLLEMRKKILKAQKPIRESSNKGTSINWNEKLVLEKIFYKAKDSDQPLSRFLDPESFDTEEILKLTEEIINILIENGAEKNELEKLKRELLKGKFKLSDLIRASLNEDLESFEDLASQLGINAVLLLFIVDMLIQPCLEEIYKKASPSFIELWRKPHCPICGRKAIVARGKERKRYLICTLCNAEYLTDLFICPHCENVDSYTLKFLSPKKFPQFRIDYCDKCKHYIKVIDDEKLKENIPRGLEDILTLNLDFLAKNAGLTRI